MGDEEHLPGDLLPLYVIILEDTIRKNTRETLDYFHREGVDVKVISGDHLKTVSMIAKKAGLRRWNDAIDLSAVGEDADFDRICQDYAVFARVTPKQKQLLVQALKRGGHQVAMTGDGVNDLLALREADCSIAVAEGSDASRQISQIVLLNSDFTHLPQVLLEGRKVVNNVTRTAGVFFIKTIYSVLVSIFCLISNVPFPFIPIQITLVDAFVEAYPSFLTIFESDTRRLRGTFLGKALSNAGSVCTGCDGDDYRPLSAGAVRTASAADGDVSAAADHFHAGGGQKLYSVFKTQSFYLRDDGRRRFCRSGNTSFSV